MVGRESVGLMALARMPKLTWSSILQQASLDTSMVISRISNEIRENNLQCTHTFVSLSVIFIDVSQGHSVTVARCSVKYAAEAVIGLFVCLSLQNSFSFPIFLVLYYPTNLFIHQCLLKYPFTGSLLSLLKLCTAWHCSNMFKNMTFL